MYADILPVVQNILFKRSKHMEFLKELIWGVKEFYVAILGEETDTIPFRRKRAKHNLYTCFSAKNIINMSKVNF